MCHANGCALVTTGMNDKASISGFKTLLAHFLFSGDMGPTTEKEHDKPMYIQPGKDSLSTIGEPKVIMISHNINRVRRPALQET